MRNYQAIFFDWDGTAVTSRKAPVDEVVLAMKPLLAKGINLAIVSGTTIENIAGGHLADSFTKEELSHLFLGLGRGAYHYEFQDGIPCLFGNELPKEDELIRIHQICYEIHERLLMQYQFPTDIVFSRPNYCKIDLMVENNRGEQLFFQENELVQLEQSLKQHGIEGGLYGLVQLAQQISVEFGFPLIATTDAKYLEVGLSCKSSNVNAILNHLSARAGITARDCSFWGDEYLELSEHIYGSDSFMITELTREGDFFDVSEASGNRPGQVQVLHGGVTRFLDFLKAQNQSRR